MRLRLLAPFRSDLSIQSELSIQNPDDYRGFWDRISTDYKQQRLSHIIPTGESAERGNAEEAGAIPESTLDRIQLHFPHGSPYLRIPFNRYKTLDTDSLERTLHLLELQIPGEVLEDEEFARRVHEGLEETRRETTDGPDDAAPECSLVEKLQAVTIRVFDHGVSLLEADVDLGRLENADRDVGAWLDAMQREAVQLGEALANRLWGTVLAPVIRWLRSNSPEDCRLFEPSTLNRQRGERYEGDVLWVTRTLIVETGDAPDLVRPIVRHWLKDSGQSERKDGRTHVAWAEDDDRAHVLRWLNYLFREKAYPAGATIEPPARADPQGRARDALARPFCDPWEAMLHAQYYYAALELVDGNLTRILADALSQRPRRTLKELKRDLQLNIRNANMLVLQHHDSAKYYKRAVDAELSEILDYWNFKELLMSSVQKKSADCTKRLDLLHQRDAARSTIFTDLILLGIGATAIFSTALATAQYGRQILTDSSWVSFDVGGGQIVQWLGSQPTDLLLGISVLLILVLGFLVYFLKMKRIG